MAGLNETPKGERLHIAFFGNRNAGKSSLINAFTGQDISIVSDTKGTTTDPVFKAMELLPLGPVMIIDTPGIDDEGELGALRVQKALQVLRKTDVMVIVTDCTKSLGDTEKQLIAMAGTHPRIRQNVRSKLCNSFRRVSNRHHRIHRYIRDQGF